MVKQWFKSGSPWIWMTAGAVSISLVSVIGLLLLIASRGLVWFWPSAIQEITLHSTPHQTSPVIIGEIYSSEIVPLGQLKPVHELTEGEDPQRPVTRYLVKTGNRDITRLDFRWIVEDEIKTKTQPDDLLVIERSRNGNFYGRMEKLVIDGHEVFGELASHWQQALARSSALTESINELERDDIGGINYRLEQIRIQEKTLRASAPDRKLSSLAPSVLDDLAALDSEKKQLRQLYQSLESRLFLLREELNRDKAYVREMGGKLVEINFSQIISITYPNQLGMLQKISHFFSRIGDFVSDEPREVNTEGGVFPAIFGTVFMVLLMAVIVTPLGVIAAVYLHEYAGKNWLTRIIRISVINLAGVPSVVYGVFGLGLFVYTFGGSIDRAFYEASLPAPTFGTPGVLWSALTLAILTLPVVIVSTEEGLSRIPDWVRDGSLALGATKAETLWRIVLPMASPAIMTGLILAVARAAGEVAPLMLVGVVKMAPTLPIDGNFPFVHLERKFMHLGYHIYDVGFQSPNIEAARPLVYASAFLLVTVIVTLNITAIAVRNHLREKFKSLDNQAV